MKHRILAGLKNSRPAGDLVAEALARLPPGAAGRLFPDPLIPAAVLVPLFEQGDELQVLLTRRTAHLRDHAGQISFPGGRLEPDDRDPAAAALREAREEIGLGTGFVELIGYLPPHAVSTGYAVSPVVGLLQPGFGLRRDPAEVAEIITVPLTFLLDPANLERSTRTVRGVELTVCAYQFGPHHIWGATAQILRSLCEIIHEKD